MTKQQTKACNLSKSRRLTLTIKKSVSSAYLKGATDIQIAQQFNLPIEVVHTTISKLKSSGVRGVK